MGSMLQKGAYSKDMLFVEQLLTGLVAANAIKDVQSLSQAPGMFSTVHKHLLKAGTLPSDGKPSLHMSTLVGLNPLQVREAKFNPVYLAFLTVMLHNQPFGTAYLGGLWSLWVSSAEQFCLFICLTMLVAACTEAPGLHCSSVQLFVGQQRQTRAQHRPLLFSEHASRLLIALWRLAINCTRDDACLVLPYPWHVTTEQHFSSAMLPTASG